MTERDKRELTDTEDELDKEQEAQLHYRGAARRKDKDRRGNTPMPLAAGGAGAGAGTANAASAAPGAAAGAGMTNSATFAGAPVAVGGAAMGTAAADAPQAASADVRFTSEQLSAGAVGDPDSDPWGAYDNPDNVPGLSLDEDEQEGNGSGYRGMAMRGSGTRGGSGGGGGRMGPMMPMGAGGTGAGAAGAGGAAALPGATVGGIGVMPNAAMQSQQAAMQTAMTGAQQGSLPISALSSLNGMRATSAMGAPPASGVMAAGTDGFSLHPDALADTIRRLGMDTDSPYVVGPDGQLYPNPYYTGGGVQGPGSGGGGGGMVPGVNGGFYPAAADLDGDGVVSAAEAQRWAAAQERTSGGSSGPGLGITGPGDGGYNYAPGTGSGSGSGSDSGSDGGSGIIGDINSGAYRGSDSSGSSQGSATGGVKDTVGGLNSDAYSGSLSSGTSASGGSGISRDFGSTSAVSGATSIGTGSTGGTKTFNPDVMRQEAREWDRIAAEQEALAKQLSSMPDSGPIFGVLERMPPTHRSVEVTFTRGVEEGSVASTNTDAGLQQSAALTEQTEDTNTGIGQKVDQ